MLRRLLPVAGLVIACFSAPAAVAAGPVEPATGASGRTFSGTAKDGSLAGFADDHVHITANLRAGGRVIYGEPFDRGLARYHRLGIRSLFIAHWLDNAFAGAALEGGLKGLFINALNRLETGHYFRVSRCPQAGQGEQAAAPPKAVVDLIAPFFRGVSELAGVPVPAYPQGPRCNARGLTALGVHLVRRMMKLHMIVEADHMSERARNRLLRIAAARHYPVVSGHNGTGGAWTNGQLRKLYAVGGIAATTLGTAPELIRSIDRFAHFGHGRRDFGVPLGSDVGGFASLPGPSGATKPLRYPFKAFRGHVTFHRQRTGRRVFDLNTDGVAHYGLVADLLADVERRPGGHRALRTLFHSAEAYLDMWRRTGAR